MMPMADAPVTAILIHHENRWHQHSDLQPLIGCWRWARLLSRRLPLCAPGLSVRWGPGDRAELCDRRRWIEARIRQLEESSEPFSARPSQAPASRPLRLRWGCSTRPRRSRPQ